jgi:hypothetical protein
MSSQINECPKFAWIVLFGLGIMDLVRGCMHIFFIDFAIATFAHLDLSCAPDDQKMLLMAFCISNFLTGAIFIIISQKARQIVGLIIPLIPFCYFVGAIVIKSTLHPTSDFLGQWFMLMYFIVCIGTSLAIYLPKWFKKLKK